jgi:ribonuclease VapC
VAALHVLDASALLALMQAEPGADVVNLLIEEQECVVSSVNFAEVGGKLIDKGLAAEQLVRVLKELDIQVIDFDAQQALACAALRQSTRKIGLSLGDRACLALAQLMQGCAVTADRAWVDVEKMLKVPVKLIR